MPRNPLIGRRPSQQALAGALVVVTLLTLDACGGDSDTPVDRWSLLAEGRPSALLAVWGSSPHDVWVVGGRQGVNEGPVVLHYDGGSWQALDTGERNIDLWWVFGFVNGPVLLGGSNGTILRYQDGAFVRLSTPTTDVVFGMWGASPNDVWAVGGQLGGGGAFAWRFQGTLFAPVDGVPAALATGGTVWKNTGRSASEVWMSASSGVTLRWDGTMLVEDNAGMPDESLFSIACTSASCVAVGGSVTNGVLYENNGSGWVSRVPTVDGPVWRGVAASPDDAWAVGQFGAVIHRSASGWTPEPNGLTTETFHAAWIDPAGGLWAVGGKFDTTPTRDGVLVYRGIDQVPMVP